MGRGWGLRRIGLRALLFSLTLQAMTPDALDPASLSPLHFVAATADAGAGAGALAADCSDPLGEPSPFDDQDLPSDDGGRDERPDEACLPTSVSLGLCAQRAHDGPGLHGFSPRPTDDLTPRDGPGGLTRPPAVAMGPRDSILSSCRLTC